MKNKIYRVLSMLFYLISFTILLFLFVSRFVTIVELSTNVKMILLLSIFILVYLAGLILVKKLNYSKNILKFNLIIYFLIYIVIVFSLTLFEELYGRNGLMFIKWDKELFKEYFSTSFNIVPFDTIKIFINGYNKNIVSFKDFFLNIFGNLIVFMPCSIFLPMIFKNLKRYTEFFVYIVCIVLIIEFLQFITLSGSFDIDDLILNVLGASIMYFIYNIKFIKKIINKFFFLENN